MLLALHWVLSSFVDTLETFHAFKIKIMHIPPKYAASTLEVRNNMFFIHPPNHLNTTK
jgi:hypothetical protein